MELGSTLTQFLIEKQWKFKDATGEFTGLLADIATAAKVISQKVKKAGLNDIIGYQGGRNVHGEQVQKLDLFANDTFIKALSPSGQLIAIVSEEMKDPHQISGYAPKGKYVLLMDPLDGSSNIDVNISIGSIFSIYRRKGDEAQATMEDFLQPGRLQVCAGYILYGSSTMLIYTTGFGVHGFTLDPGIGEFLLSHENIRIPEEGGVYSINEAYASRWDEGIKEYVDEARKEGKTARYVGSLVADFHRNLLKGGIFLYPGNSQDPKGKLRLLYEASPLAYIVEQAGGSATTGRDPILDVVPEALHQKVPLVIGSKKDVEKAGIRLRAYRRP
ncbi:MAG: class 1 fructose-bisphosphatase [Nitrospiria bacterium]